MVVCVYEDRADALIGVELLVISLARHWPEAGVLVSCPAAPEGFSRWMQAQPNGSLVSEPDLGSRGWDMKPKLLRRRLAEGHDRVVWIDSDIILTAPPPTVLSDPGGPLVATEETYWGQAQGGGQRARAWGLPVGRALATTVNTGVVAVSPRHDALLAAWEAMLDDPRYVAARATPHRQRPLHLLSDQEALTALLTSADWADEPLHLLRRGRDIAQCFGPGGYTVRERVRSLRKGGLPPLVHAMGGKPWLSPPRPPATAGRGERARALQERLHAQLSPYRAVAAPYEGALSDPDAACLRAEDPPARALRALARDNPVAQELPVAAVDSLVRAVRRVLGIGRFKLG